MCDDKRKVVKTQKDLKEAAKTGENVTVET